MECDSILDRSNSCTSSTYNLTTSSGHIRPYLLRTFIFPGPASSSPPPSNLKFAPSTSELQPLITPIPTLLSPTHSRILDSYFSGSSGSQTESVVWPKPIHNPPYRISSHPRKGLGLFSTRPISRGELIAWERPGVIVPSLRLSQDKGEDEGKHEEEAYKALVDAFFAFNQDSLSTTFMNPAPTHNDNQKIFSNAARTRHDAIHNMAIAPRYLEMHWLKGVLRTNAIVLDFGFKDAVRNKEEEKEVYGGIFPLINRCNHSCRPNASTYFLPSTQRGFNPSQPPLLVLVLYALRDIPAGEEITKSYVDPFLPRQHRRKVLLENYGFDCDCDACCASDPDMNSDAKREEILTRLLTPTFSRWLSVPPSLPSSTLDFLLTTHTKTLHLLTSSSLHAPRLLIEEELAWACAAEGDKEGFVNWAGKVVGASGWVRELGLDLVDDKCGENGIHSGRTGGKVKKWRGKDSMPPSGLEGFSTWLWYLQDPGGRVPAWGWRRREREDLEKFAMLKESKPCSRGFEVEEGILNGIFGN